MNIAKATDAVRIHHQWLPDELWLEKALDEDIMRWLIESGYSVKIKGNTGCTESIMRINNLFYSASDLRGQSSLTMGY